MLASTSISSNIVPLLFQLPPRRRFKLGGQFFYALSPVSFDDADHHVFTVATAANALAEHGVGLADARRIPQEKLERSLGFLAGRDLLEPLFGFLGHGSRIVPRGTRHSRITPR